MIWVGPVSSQGSLEVREAESKSMGERLAIAGFRDGRWPWAKECEQLPEAERVKTMDSPQNLQKRMQTYQHLDFNPVSSAIVDFWLPELQDDKFVLFYAINVMVICKSSKWEINILCSIYVYYIYMCIYIHTCVYIHIFVKLTTATIIHSWVL